MGMERPTILIVDDLPEHIDVLTGLLQREYRIKAASNGSEALEILHSSDPPDLVLLDVLLPDTSGHDICRQITSDPVTSEIPVIFITVLDTEASVSQGFEAGAVDYVTKPFEPREVKARVRNHIALMQARHSLTSKNQQLQQSYEQLREAEEARNELFHMVVHDLRAPITSLMLIFDLLKPGHVGMDDNTQAEMVSSAHQILEGMTELIGSVLDLKRLESLEMTLNAGGHDLLRTIGEAVTISGAHLAPVEFELDAPRELPEAHYDDLLIRRVLVNLLSNAIRHSGRGDRITLRVVSGEEWHTVEVTDQGPGVPEEKHEDIFKKYVQLSKEEAHRRHGSGIGLAYCKLAVELHGGEIKLRSKPGEGSCFSFTVPVKPQTEKQVAQGSE